MNSSDPSYPIPVAIIGMGCMFPRADGLARYWANIRNCVDAITEVPESHWKLADYYDRDPQAPDRTYAHRGGFLAPVDFPLLDFGISPHSIDATDTTQLLGLLVARAALDDAGYPFDGDLDRDRVSVVLGVTGTLELVIPLGARLGHPVWRSALRAAGVDADTSEDVVKRIAASYVDWQENSFPGLLGNVAAGRIANRLDLRGTNCVVDAACASSLGALNLAMLELAARRCDLAVTGGLDAFNDIFMYMCFSKTPALSPSGDARPFDTQADGTVLGEGLGVLVLKRLEDARRDNDRIYAVIRALGSSSDGKGQAVYAPSSAGQASALRSAYESAGISPATVELVEAHGTGTRVGDGVELAALEEVYRGARASAPWCALGSVKSQVGHTKAAAGAAGMIKAALALYHKVLPPTAKVSRPIDPLLRADAPFYVVAAPRPWLPRHGHPRRAAVSAFGFGGSNFHCILEEADAEKPGIDWDGDVQILAFSAEKAAELTAALRTLDTRRNWEEVRETAAISRSCFNVRARYRALLVARQGGTDIAELAAKAIASLEAQPDGMAPRHAGRDTDRATHDAGRAFTGAGPRAGRLAMLFPGQGSQYVGMLRELACQFPRMQTALAVLDHAFGRPDAQLADWIYPHSAFDEKARLSQEAALCDTRIAQPAIGAVSLGAWRILEQFGVRPDLAGGHSFGELTALCAGGRIDEEELAYLACRRGQLMADCARCGEPGTMLAVFAALDDLLDLVREEGLDLVVANRNAPRQQVLAGAHGEIERARVLCAVRGIATHSVPVSAAFHSRFVASVREAFRDALQSINPTGVAIPVFANLSALPYPDDATELRELLAGQLAEPVQFARQIEEMYRMGARAFVEVGPDAKLTGLVSHILEGRAYAALAMDRSRGAAGNTYDLACLLASLAALGYAVDLNQWDSGPIPRVYPRKHRGLTAKISGANAKPKSSMRDDRSGNHPRTPDQPPTPAASPAATSPPRFSIATRPAASPPMDFQPRKNGSIDTMTDFHTRMNAQAASNDADQSRPDAACSDETRATAHARQLAEASLTAPDTLRAFQAAQENLNALQMLARQTADVHRLFLEGQDRILQTFAKLLEEEQRAERTIKHPEKPVPPPASVSLLDQRHPGASCRTIPPSALAVSSDLRDRNGATERWIAPAAAAPGQSRETEVQPVAPAAPDADHVARTVIEVVSEKTGYPPDVLGLDMKLDADLGIDSIKRVEILSALHERLPGLPTLVPEQVGALGTLRAIAELVARPADESDSEAAADIRETGNGEAIGQELLEVVAEKTGYPLDMLTLDMKLDADLGIDSIKRVEILSAIQDRLPGLPALKPEQLGTLRTLGEIAAALAQPDDWGDLGGASNSGDRQRDGRAGREAVDCGRAENQADRSAPGANGSVEARGPVPDRGVWPERNGGPGKNGSDAAGKVELVRRYLRAVPLIEPEQRHDIRLPAGGKIWIIDDGSDLSRSVRERLQERGYAARVIALADRITPAEDEILCGLIILAPRHPSDRFISEAFRSLRAAGPALQRAARTGCASLLTVSRLDGCFGVAGLAAEIDPVSGALAGFAKTAGHEWSGVHCKAVDLASAMDDAEAAAGLIVAELFKRGPVEVCLTALERLGLELAPVPVREPAAGRRRSPAKGDLILVSGGARGVTAAVAAALAQAFQPRFVLLGRSAAPGLEDPGLASFTSETELKRALVERSGRRLVPSELGEQARQILAGREIRKTLARIEAAGSTAGYLSLDVRDRAAVSEALRRIRAEHGPIRGLIHGAGALADRRITDQTDAQFSLVYDTKVKGLENLLEGVELELLELLILFSSSTARFGRTGQVAYAAANEALNKYAQRLAVQLPGCRVISYNWGPWDGGMVTEDLKPVFAREGIALIPPLDGAALVVRDMELLDRSAAEIVVLANPEPGGTMRLGPGEPADLGQPFQADVELESLTSNTLESAASPPRSGPRVARAGNAAVARKLETAFHREVSVEAVPVLASHVIDGHAVLPMALILEWLAEAAAQRNPGLVVSGMDEMKLYKGVILNGPPSVAVELRAAKAVRAGGEFRVAVEMFGTLSGGREAPLARAQVVLSERHSSGSPRLFHRTAGGYPHSPDEIYRSLLFHGPAMQGIERVDGCNQHGISGRTRTAPVQAEWVQRPMRAKWLFDPLAIDCAFQLVVLWSRKQLGANSLPTGLGSYRQYSRHFPPDGVRVVAEIREALESRAVADIEFLDAEEDLVARLEGYECVIDLSLNEAFRRNELAGATEARAEASVSVD